MFTIINLKIIAAALLAISAIGGALIYEQQKTNALLTAQIDMQQEKDAGIAAWTETHKNQRKTDLEAFGRMGRNPARLSQ